MPFPDDQFSTKIKDIRSSRIVNTFKNNFIPEVFHYFISKLKFC